MSTWLGFRNRYRAACWTLFGGALFVFALVRLKYLDFYGAFCGSRSSGALPGECFYFLQPGLARTGMIVHLYCVLPASILAVGQFVPVVRRKAIAVHRINGYACLVLGLVGSIAAFPSFRRAFGGDPAAQLANFTLLALFVWGCIMGYWSVKGRRIRDHRAWMLRAWCYVSPNSLDISAGGIITVRILMIAFAVIISIIEGYYMAQPCDKIDFVLDGRNNTLSRYPGCEPFYSGKNLNQHVVVDANVMNINMDLMQLVAAFNVAYPMSAWISLSIHVIGPELYLRMTQDGMNSYNSSTQKMYSNMKKD
ncbi:uncharacterized protein JN550_003869 [Neoarthrinium moseri]|uniref:uncharacterized protein n=1 Tax=Neoarthrinium moseri TaxID=1658444 RepID=UPI001FDCFD0A|nr:uncharacterized protein JN550_003869 [Neoarthrinium moseri]KAI1872995.1 hypothetical protein JN550_003869 [Neoarthrinium moseri]